MRTAYIELRERADHVVETNVKLGASYGAVRVVAPDGCTVDGASWTCARPLAGRSIRVEGLGPLVADAVVVHSFGGATASTLVRAASPTWTIPERGGGLAGYVRAGFAHVLTGLDHLAFLVALVVLLRRPRAVILAETAFTVSHSVAFSAAALGWVHVPAPVAEAAIALSLVLLAAERRQRSGARAAFVFGAVHGLGFAGGLEELGAPRDAVLSALGGFALGVELAQVIFLFLCFAVLTAARAVAIDRFVARAATAAVGVSGAYWLFERVNALVDGWRPS